MLKKLDEEFTSIQQNILDEYQNSLGDSLAGLIFCGSISSTKKVMNDIDYLVVIDNMEYLVLPCFFDVKKSLEELYKIKLSDTAITLSEINNFRDTIQCIDGKAAQALIEATLAEKRVITNEGHTINIPVVDSSSIKNFSKQNFYALSGVLRKHLIRSNHHESVTFRLKILKLVAIILKMRIQYTNQEYFMKTDSITTSQSKDDIELLKKIEENKSRNNGLSAAITYDLLPKILDDSLFC